MIIFHEGLPGSGKSYESVITRVLPALTKRRQVFAFINGLNFQKFSDITGISLDKLKGTVSLSEIKYSEYTSNKHRYTRTIDGKYFSVQYDGLLHQINDEQVKNIYDFVADDSLVVIDEVQDYFPTSTRKLDDGITKFVTQHRHRGIDIIVMGQDHRDCHNLWKRRIDQLITFVKRDAVGMPNSYTWTTFKQNKGRFKQLNSGKGTYDSKYFGLYASHVVGAENTDTYNDDRSNIFKSSLFRVYIPIFVLISFFAIYYLSTIFSGERTFVNTSSGVSAKISGSPIVSSQDSNENDSSKGLTDDEETELDDVQSRIKSLNDNFSESNYVERISTEYRPRLSALVFSKDKLVATIEFLDSGFHAQEVLTLTQLASLGWSYKHRDYGILLYKDQVSFVVTAWPIDVFGRVSKRTNNAINRR